MGWWIVHMLTALGITHKQHSDQASFNAHDLSFHMIPNLCIYLSKIVKSQLSF